MIFSLILLFLLCFFMKHVVECEGHTCHSDGACVQEKNVCDKIPDCADGSDEQDCRELWTGTQLFDTFFNPRTSLPFQPATCRTSLGAGLATASPSTRCATLTRIAPTEEMSWDVRRRARMCQRSAIRGSSLNASSRRLANVSIWALFVMGSKIAPGERMSEAVQRVRLGDNSLVHGCG